LGALMMPGVPAEAIARQSAAISVVMEGASKESFAGQCRAQIAPLVQSAADADRLAQAAARSDVKTVARAMQEVMTADLRDSCARITSPVLLIGAAEYAKDDAARASARSRYEQQVASIPKHKVSMVFDARHFVMLDKPAEFQQLVDQFLAGAQ
jgi:pimeloyl-ACP methyl ester carboxylesterase